MSSVFPSCLSSSALRFRPDAGRWSANHLEPDDGSDFFRAPYEPSSVALELAEEMLPRTETLRQIAVRYLEIYVDDDRLTRTDEWFVDGLEFDLPPLLAPDQFTLCLRHPGDPRALWRVIFRRLPAHEAALMGEAATPVALHREVRRWEWS